MESKSVFDISIFTEINSDDYAKTKMNPSLGSIFFFQSDMYSCMKTIWLPLVFALLLVGCSAKQQEPLKSYPSKPTVGVVVIDINGYKYRLVSLEKSLGGVLSQSELWERIDPLETNHWYTPTLASKKNTNSSPMFNTLMR